MTNDLGREGTATQAGPGGDLSPTAAGSPSRPMPGPVVEGGPGHRVPADVGLPAPHPTRTDLRAWAAQYAARLRGAYGAMVTEFAAGVLHAASCIDRTLDANTFVGSTSLRVRLLRLCEVFFDQYPHRTDGYSTGALMIAGDLYIALNTWPGPGTCGQCAGAHVPVALGGAA